MYASWNGGVVAYAYRDVPETFTVFAEGVAAALDPRDTPVGRYWPQSFVPVGQAIAEVYGFGCRQSFGACDGGLGGPDLGGLGSAFVGLGAQATVAWAVANGALDVATAPPAAAPAQPGWNEIVLSLPQDLVVPAGGELEVRIVLVNPETLTQHVPQPIRDRSDMNALWRPEALNFHDSPSYPARLEVKVVTG